MFSNVGLISDKSNNDSNILLMNDHNQPGVKDAIFPIPTDATAITNQPTTDDESTNLFALLKQKFHSTSKYAVEGVEHDNNRGSYGQNKDKQIDRRHSTTFDMKRKLPSNNGMSSNNGATPNVVNYSDNRNSSTLSPSASCHTGPFNAGCRSEATVSITEYEQQQNKSGDDQLTQSVELGPSKAQAKTYDLYTLNKKYPMGMVSQQNQDLKSASYEHQKNQQMKSVNQTVNDCIIKEVDIPQACSPVRQQQAQMAHNSKPGGETTAITSWKSFSTCEVPVQEKATASWVDYLKLFSSDGEENEEEVNSDSEDVHISTATEEEFLVSVNNNKPTSVDVSETANGASTIDNTLLSCNRPSWNATSDNEEIILNDDVSHRAAIFEKSSIRDSNDVAITPVNEAADEPQVPFQPLDKVAKAKTCKKTIRYTPEMLREIGENSTIIPDHSFVRTDITQYNNPENEMNSYNQYQGYSRSYSFGSVNSVTASLPAVPSDAIYKPIRQPVNPGSDWKKLNFKSGYLPVRTCHHICEKCLEIEKQQEVQRKLLG
ncbi:hypothetical protein BDF20DRAFT_307138 [Mycotypha africana]|uniref:uncharacterized protein n=1 Tax=Mycotypha africana TaxID=64632 RepID=UPI002300D7AF|nr:uncharacterized protein BDF20DRAFT_307138 [Mycotypha africana]KAI8988142.1 hypothetical protein BDF20DRAFT_307138 [Mycotypha africana]